jgi:hypothetical protein
MSTKKTAPSKEIEEIKTKDIIISLDSSETIEELEIYIKNNFGEISTEAATVFFNYINK